MSELARARQKTAKKQRPGDRDRGKRESRLQFPKNPGVDFGGGSICPTLYLPALPRSVACHVPATALRPLSGTWGQWWAVQGGGDTERGQGQGKAALRPLW